MKVCIINQARMASKRLPGKVLKEVLGKSLLEYQIERLKRSKRAHELVVATTVRESDDRIVSLCRRLFVSHYRGSEEDVLARFYEAAKIHKADVVVRVTGDSPLIDPEVVDQIILEYIENAAKYDHVSNIVDRTYPRGMDCEVFPFRILEEVWREAREKRDREHVTSFIRNNRERYRLKNVSYSESASRHRWAVDEQNDFELIKRMIEALYPVNSHFTLRDCLRLLEDNPEWLLINSNVVQKSDWKDKS